MRFGKPDLIPAVTTTPERRRHLQSPICSRKNHCISDQPEGGKTDTMQIPAKWIEKSDGHPISDLIRGRLDAAIYCDPSRR